MVTGIPIEILQVNSGLVTRLRSELEALRAPTRTREMLINIHAVRFAVLTMIQLGSTRIEELIPYSTQFCYDVMTPEQADRHLATRDSKFEAAFMFHMLPFCPYQFLGRPVVPKFINILNFLHDINACYYKEVTGHLGMTHGD